MTSFSISVLRKVLGILFICLWIFTLAKAEDSNGIAKAKMAARETVTCVKAIQVPPVQQPGVDNCTIVRTSVQPLAVEFTGRW